MGSGIGRFTFSAVDALDNTGTQLSAGTQLEIYHTATPPPTGAPVNLRATTLPGGRIALVWDSVDKAETYKVYRKDGACDLDPTVSIATDLTAANYTDTTPVDGIYCYAVSSNRLGSESNFSNLGPAFSDRSAPLAPENLVVDLLSNGVHLSWNRPSSGDTPVRYNVYRDGAVIKTVVDSGAQMSTVDYPNTGGDIHLYRCIRGCGRQ